MAKQLIVGIAAVGGFIVGAAVERHFLAGRREARQRQQQAEAQLHALEALADRLDDEFGDSLSSTGAVLEEQLQKVGALLLLGDANASAVLAGPSRPWSRSPVADDPPSLLV